MTLFCYLLPPGLLNTTISEFMTPPTLDLCLPFTHSYTSQQAPGSPVPVTLILLLYPLVQRITEHRLRLHSQVGGGGQHSPGCNGVCDMVLSPGQLTSYSWQMTWLQESAGGSSTAERSTVIDEALSDVPLAII